MALLKLNDPETFEASQDAINRREPFQVLIAGVQARMVRKLLPFFNHYWGVERKPLRRIDALKYAMYALFTGDFGAIFYSAMKAGMVARWEDSGNSLVCSFEMGNGTIEGDSDCHEGGRSVRNQSERAMEKQ